MNRHQQLRLVAFRLTLGTLTLVAVLLQALYLRQMGALNLTNYLSYFTNLSNILAGIIFIVSAFYVLKSRAALLRDDIIRGAATLYMVVTGIVYVTLLINEDLGLLMPWVNVVTHIIMPLAVIFDWLHRPPRTRLEGKHVAMWLAFPLCYLVYTLIRGALIDWYPYPFLNPASVGGYGGVALYCIGICVAFGGIGWLLLITSRWRTRTTSRKV